MLYCWPYVDIQEQVPGLFQNRLIQDFSLLPPSSLHKLVLALFNMNFCGGGGASYFCWPSFTASIPQWDWLLCFQSFISDKKDFDIVRLVMLAGFGPSFTRPTPNSTFALIPHQPFLA